MNKIGIDLGGTKIEGILLDETLKTVKRKRIPTNRQNGYNSILESIENLVNDLRQISDKSTSIGICTPGSISSDTGVLKNSNTQCLTGKSIQNDLEQILDQKILIENDANCFALAEARLGAGKKSNLVFGVIMGTGVGGGIIIDKEIHHGRINIAGEWGHHCIHNEGNICYCGKKGCVEAYISGTALEKNWFELSNLKQSLPEIIKNLYNPNFKNWKKNFIENFGLSLSNVIDILDPDMIILGGGLSNIDFLYDEGKNSVYEKVFSDVIDTPIVKNKLGDSAGVFGACLL